MGISVKWISLGIMCFKISMVSCYYPEYIVEDLCKIGNESIIYDTTKLGSAGTLKATSHPPYSANKNCMLIIRPPADRGVVLSVRKIDLRERRFSCQDYLKVIHSDVFTSPTTICRFKYDLKEKLSFYSKGPMTIIYHVEPGDYPKFTLEEGFTLTYTVVSEDMQDCIRDDVFMCENGKCVSKEVTCDGRNNCGDRSDESHFLCDSKLFDDFQMTDVMYGVVFSVLILSIIVASAIVISRKRRRTDDADSVSDQDEPTARLTPYQTVHPTGFFICQNPAGPNSVYSHQSKAMQLEGGFSNPCYPTGIPPPPPPYSQ